MRNVIILFFLIFRLDVMNVALHTICETNADILKWIFYIAYKHFINSINLSDI